MIYRLGDRGRRVYDEVRERIDSGELAVGARVPSLRELSEAFGVAPVTVRHALSVLESEGRVVREQGKGTFVRQPMQVGVLVVDDEENVRRIMARTVEAAGFRAIEADGPAAALRALARDRELALVFTDIRMPEATDGIAFIRTIRRRWPDLPIAAVTGFADDLDPLQGTKDCPVLVLRKPVRAAQVHEALRLAVPRATLPARPITETWVLLVGGDGRPNPGLRDAVDRLGGAVTEAVAADQALEVMGRRRFSHVFVDLPDPSAGRALAGTISRSYPDAVVVLCTPREEVASGGGPVVVLETPIEADTLRSVLRLTVVG